MLPSGLALAAFIVGWPLKAYRRMSDLDLVERMKPHFWSRTEQGAFERQNEMRHQRTDEIMALIRDGQRATLALTGAVERATEGVKYANERIEEVQQDLEELKRRAHN